MIYTEKDIQDYLDGTFTGDVQAMKRLLAQDPGAQKIFQEYQSLYSALKDEPAPVLSFDLAGSVLRKLAQRRERKEKFWSGVLTFALIALSLAGVSIALSYFSIKTLTERVSAPFVITIIVLGVGFLTAFNFIEVEIRRRKFGL